MNLNELSESTADEQSDFETDDEAQNDILINKNEKLNVSNIFLTKDIIQYQKNNIVYFIDSKGRPMDKGAKLCMIRGESS